MCMVCTIRVWYKYAYGTEHRHQDNCGEDVIPPGGCQGPVSDPAKQKLSRSRNQQSSKNTRRTPKRQGHWSQKESLAEWMKEILRSLQEGSRRQK